MATEVKLELLDLESKIAIGTIVAQAAFASATAYVGWKRWRSGKFSEATFWLLVSLRSEERLRANGLKLRADLEKKGAI